jgi:hypothetical protein
MPFDFLPAETRTLTLAELSRVLRNPQEWPKGFKWNYGSCRQCGMGLAFRLLKKKLPLGMDLRDIGSLVMSRRLGIPYEAAKGIFFDVGKADKFGERTIERTDITPIHVADAIDAYLAGERGKEA